MWDSAWIFYSDFDGLRQDSENLFEIHDQGAEDCRSGTKILNLQRITLSMPEKKLHLNS